MATSAQPRPLPPPSPPLPVGQRSGKSVDRYSYATYFPARSPPIQLESTWVLLKEKYLSTGLVSDFLYS
jgi:hypothetical protein